MEKHVFSVVLWVEERERLMEKPLAMQSIQTTGLHSVLIQQVTWKVLSPKELILHIDESDSPSDLFCKTPYQQKAKSISKHLFYWYGRGNDKEHGTLPNQGCVGNLSWIRKCCWCLTWFVIFNEWRSGSKCLSTIPFYFFPRGLPLLGCLHMPYLYTWPVGHLFSPQVSMRAWL